MQEHMTHGDINRTHREREALGHSLPEGDMLVPDLDHLLPRPCEHGRCAIHADHLSYKRSHHSCKIPCPCSHVEHRHLLPPWQQPGEPFLKFNLVGARHIVIPGRCDLLKIVSFVRFDMLQLLLWRGRQIDPHQCIEMLKNLLICRKQVLEPSSQVLLLQQLARPPQLG